MLAGRNIQRNRLENSVATRLDGDRIENNAWGGFDSASRLCARFFRSAQRLEQPQRGVSQQGILPRGRGSLLAQNRQVEHPINQQQDAPNPMSGREARPNDPGRQGQACGKLQSFQPDDRALKPASCASPFRQQSRLLMTDSA
jgi:hypothetical protein